MSKKDINSSSEHNAPGVFAAAKGSVRYIYIALGVIAFALGVVATVIPLIPTTPLIILSAFCFSKSSDKLHAWLLSTRFYRNTLEDLAVRRTMTIKAKLVLLAVITIFMSISFIVMVIISSPFLPKAVLALIWLLHMLYFGFKIKTIR